MEILAGKNIDSKIKQYKLTMSPEIEKMSGIKDDRELKVESWCQYKDTNSKGEDTLILSIDTGTAIYATNSTTFMEDFFRINDIMEGEEFSIRVHRGVSKNDREFITCVLVG